MEKKVYIIAGYGYTAEEVFTNKETAEKKCKEVQDDFWYGGYDTTVYVEEIRLVED